VDEDPRVSQDQRDEVEALAAMLTADELVRLAPAWPVRLSVGLTGLGGGGAAALRFTMPPAYPHQVACRCEFETDRPDLLAHAEELMGAVEVAREPLGFPSIFAMVQAAQLWAEEYQCGAVRGGGSGGEADAAAEAEEQSLADSWWLKDDEDVDLLALAEAEREAARLMPDCGGGGRCSGVGAQAGVWARECGAGSYGRPWSFVAGLVGKPSAGKSTFFNAATRPDRPEREASMAPHPFTTIDPNVGAGWFAAPCPSAQFGYEDTAQPEHGRAAGGRRRFPLLLKDVAGLVPGAYCGRGRGNAFLNDLCEADSLVHVVDASGRSDREGVDQGTDAAKSGSSVSGTDPLEEVDWVRREIHLWIFCNVRAKFDTVRRRARMATTTTRDVVLDRLINLFTGYHASRQLVLHVYEAAGFSVPGIADAGGVRDWREYDLHLLVACFLRARFPIVVALNKVDLPEATERVARARVVLGDACVPVSAGAEWWLLEQQRLGHLTYDEGAAGVEGYSLNGATPADVLERWERVRQLVLAPYGSTGVLEALSVAVMRRRPMFVCPVTEFGTCEGLLRAGAMTKGGGRAAPFATMVMLRPLSTVDEAFAALRHEQMLRGDFVRAEVLECGRVQGCADVTPTHRVLRRDEVLRCGGSAGVMVQAVVIRVLTNKKSQASGRQ